MKCLLGCLLPSTSKQIHSVSCAPTVPQRPRVFLVGSTGDGKSRFGSYLINPGAAVNVTAPAFEFSESSQAVTSHLSISPAVFKGKTYDIVDSPGLGESPAADLEHTIHLSQLLNNSQHIAAIIFCFRQGRVEKATKEMVYFLKEVFDSKLLAKNLLLVVTHVSQSKAALKQRQASRKSLDLILQDISMRISTAFGQPDRLPCFDIDTAPETPAAEKCSLARRQAIFKAIQARPLSHVSHLRVPKLPSMMQDDAQEVAAVSASLKGCEASLAAMFEEISRNESAVELAVEKITERRAEHYATSRLLAEVNTDDLEETGRAAGSRGMHHSHPLRLEVKADFPIASEQYHLRDRGDHPCISKPDTHTRILEVEPSSGYYGSTAATLTVFSLKKDVHIREILNYTKRVKSLKDEIEALEGAKKMLTRQSTAIRSNQVVNMQFQIMDLKGQMHRLQQKTMLLDEARERLKRMKQPSLTAVNTSHRAAAAVPSSSQSQRQCQTSEGHGPSAGEASWDRYIESCEKLLTSHDNKKDVATNRVGLKSAMKVSRK